jgi:hypothetical protein
MFCTVQWEEMHSDHILNPLSSSALDHCPLLLHSQERLAHPPMFKFEAHWPLMPDFAECVSNAWNTEVPPNQNAMMRLHIKSARTAKALSTWARKLIPLGKLTIIIYREVIAQLDNAQENRALTEDELQLKKLLKNRILGLASIERSRARQQSRLTWIRKGDANTKYFHIMASTRRKNNFIAVLNNGTNAVTSQRDKHQVNFQHFQNHIGSSLQRKHTLNYAELGWQPRQLSHLDLPFSE